MPEPIVFSGTVDWSGENAEILLKDTPDGPFVSLASFFRIVLSPHGRGHALVLLESPHDANAADNVCYHDNEALARYLVAGFVANFGDWRGLAGLPGIAYRTAGSFKSSGNPLSDYSEMVESGDTSITLNWNGLGKPFCFAFPPERSPIRGYHMTSLFVGCQEATITVDGRRLAGMPAPRAVVGQKIGTAMLAFSETWIRA